MCSFAICISSLVKCLLMSLPLFYLDFVFLLFNFSNYLYILYNSPLLNVQLANTPSLSSFQPLQMNFVETKVFFINDSQFICFFFLLFSFSVKSKNSLPNKWIPEIFFSYLPKFIVWVLTCKSVIHFRSFIEKVWGLGQNYSSPLDIQFFPALFVESTFFSPPMNCFCTFKKNQFHILVLVYFWLLCSVPH